MVLQRKSIYNYFVRHTVATYHLLTMSQHLARDYSVWNRLMFGTSRVPYVENEKESMVDDYLREKGEDQEKPLARLRKTKISNIVGLIFLLCYIAGLPQLLFKDILSSYSEMQPLLFQRYNGHALTGSINEQAGDREIFSVAFPFDPSKKYGKPVYSTLLVDLIFDLYGNPAYKLFTPPKEKFNKVVLTLNTSVGGVQYDRLAHLYVGGAEIWRTSTIEPGGNLVFSSVKKDVSTYSKLFEESSDVLFQLDNVVTDWLTGKFHIQLYADFYYTDLLSSHSEEFGAYGADVEVTADKYKIFDIRKPADQVFPLITKDNKKSPPVYYFPTDELTFKLPQVPRNTTRLKLAVFASGNAQEEFWFNNVLDKYVDRFSKDGNTFLGHGPLRFLNVYLDGEKIATQTPQPFVFTGGYSPVLWSPVVATNAFDLPSIDIDVTALLPLLWGSGVHVLKIEVSNGVDEIDSLDSGIGSNWITGANLLAYESSDVKTASGEITVIGGNAKGETVTFSPPYLGSLLEVMTGILSTELTSSLEFELINGDLLSTTASTFTEGDISNVQFYKDLGSNARIVHVGKSTKSFLLTDNLDDSAVIHQVNVSLSYPLVLVLNEKSVEGGVDLQVTIANNKVTSLDINGKNVMSETIVQNGSSVFSVRANGNYGSGTLQTTLKAQVRGADGDYNYKRVVLGSGGEVISDLESYKDIEDGDEEAFAKEIEELLKVEGCHGREHKTKSWGTDSKKGRKSGEAKSKKKHRGKHHKQHLEEHEDCKDSKKSKAHKMRKAYKKGHGKEAHEN